MHNFRLHRIWQFAVSNLRADFRAFLTVALSFQSMITFLVAEAGGEWIGMAGQQVHGA
jgi:hypothetical protein